MNRSQSLYRMLCVLVILVMTFMLSTGNVSARSQEHKTSTVPGGIGQAATLGPTNPPSNPPTDQPEKDDPNGLTQADLKRLIAENEPQRPDRVLDLPDHPDRPKDPSSPPVKTIEEPPAPPSENISQHPAVIEEPQPVSVTPSSPVDIRVQGIVVSAAGQPMPALGVRFSSSDGSHMITVTTDEEGAFAVSLTQSMQYRMIVMDSDGEPLTIQSNPWFSVDSPLAEGIQIHLAPETSISPNSSQVSTEGFMQPMEGEYGEIHGYVTAADGGAPLAYVPVNLYEATTGDYILYTYTDSLGNYGLTPVPAGTYVVRFSPYSEYIPQYYQGKESFETADQITVAAGQVVSNINPVLSREGRIVGQVVAEEDGTPLEDVYVQVYDTNGNYEQGFYTGAAGEFTISTLQTGEYRLLANPNSCYSSCASRDYISEYYNNRTTLDLADGISVTAGQDTTGIQIALKKGGSISGIITSEADGSPLSSIYVNVNGKNSGAVQYGYTESDGSYRISGLPTDEYTVNFIDNGYCGSEPCPQKYQFEYFNNKTYKIDADLVSVTAGGLTSGIDASLYQTGSISGKITASEDGTPLELTYVDAINERGIYVAHGYSDAEGNYTIRDLPAGTYRIWFWTNASWMPQNTQDHVSEYYNNRSSLAEADPVTVTAGSTTSGINAALSKGAQITGHVTSADTHQPLSDVEVVLYGLRSSAWYYDRNTLADATGQYRFSGLTPGSYRLRFITSSSPASQTREYSGEYYKEKTDWTDADIIQVSAGQVVQGMDADLNRGGSVAGRVVANDTGQPISGVTVDAYRGTPTGSHSWETSDTTDINGNYVIPGLPAGEWAIAFNPGPGVDYIAESYNQHPGYDLSVANHIQVTVGNRVNGIDASLKPGVHISGRVTSASDGTGLSVNVNLSDTSGNYWGSVETANDGSYVSLTVPAGDYRVEFSPPSWSDEWSRSHAAEYYNNQPGYAQADLIHLTLGSPVDGIDAALELGGKITGTVTAEDTGVPLPNVAVYVNSAQTGYYVPESLTRSDGTYEVIGLMAGDYTVEFSTEESGSTPTINYTKEYYTDAMTYGEATPVPVVLSQVTENIDASLQLGGRITGSITSDGSHLPLANVYINLIASTTQDYVGIGETNIAGTYTTNAVRPGEYLVWIDPSIYGSSADYIPEFSNGQDIPENAEKIIVTAGGLVTVNDSLARGGRISGQVRASDTGQGITDVSVWANNASGGYTWSDQSMWTDSNGNYSIRGIKPGAYKIEFYTWNINQGEQGSYVAEWYNNRNAFETATVINVSTTAPVLGINASLDVGGQITGKVTDANTGLALKSVYVHAYNTDGSGWGSTQTNIDGTYRISGLPAGAYGVNFSKEGYVEESYNNAHYNDVIQTVPVTLGAPTSGIDAALDTGGTITGRVTVDGGAGNIFSEVTAYDENGDAAAWTGTDQTGEYRFDLIPGTYRLGFTPLVSYGTAEYVYVRQYYNGVTLLENAQPLILADDQTISDINAVLQTGGQISGVVTGEGGISLSGVQVTISTPDGKYVDDVSTGSDGSYLTRGLAAGSYKLAFDHIFAGDSPMHLPEYYNNRATLETADLVDVTVGAITEGVDASLSAVKVGFTSTAQTVAESAGDLSLTLNLSGASLDTVSVPFYVTGGATSGVDHNLVDGVVVFAPGQTSQAIAFRVVDDQVDESDETIVVTLQTPTNAVLGTNKVHTITVQDNDQPTQSIPTPTLTSLLPTQGRNDLPTEITLTGTNFAAGATVLFQRNGQPTSSALPTQSITATSIVATVPAGYEPGLYNLIVKNPDDKQAALNGSFRVLPAEVDDLLAYSYDLWVAPATIYANQDHSIGLVVQRQGGVSTLLDVKIRFYLGNPAAGGTLIGTSTIASVPPHNATSTPSLSWTAPSAGSYSLYAVIDPDQTYPETVETNNVISRTITVNPAPVKIVDQTPPVVQSFQIAGGAEDTSSRNVGLRVQATDPQPVEGVGWVMFYEYNFNESTQQWVQAQASSWLEYSATREYPWTLSPIPGAKYLQAWAADNAGNVSAEPLTAFINFIPTSDTLARGQSRYYVYHLDSGEGLSAMVTSQVGDGDLYVWAPDFQFRDPWSSIASSGPDHVQFIAPVTGMYVVQVYGYSGATYQFTIEEISLLSMTTQAGAYSTTQTGGETEKLPLNEPNLEPGSQPSEQHAVTEAILPPIDTKWYLFMPTIRR